MNRKGRRVHKYVQFKCFMISHTYFFLIKLYDIAIIELWKALLALFYLPKNCVDKKCIQNKKELEGLRIIKWREKNLLVGINIPLQPINIYLCGTARPTQSDQSYGPDLYNSDYICYVRGSQQKQGVHPTNMGIYFSIVFTLEGFFLQVSRCKLYTCAESFDQRLN